MWIIGNETINKQELLYSENGKTSKVTGAGMDYRL